MGWLLRHSYRQQVTCLYLWAVQHRLIIKPKNLMILALKVTPTQCHNNIYQLINRFCYTWRLVAMLAFNQLEIMTH